ncbi:nucleoid occlusion protein [Bacillus tianshenii]|nr:nucleoid occlusion protein [Bacillus tianshenii]
MKHPFTRLFGLGDKQEEENEGVELESRNEVMELPVKNISPNRFQPRTIFVDARIKELSQTIEAHGMIQPIVVRQYGEEQYEIIAGERRWRAVQKLGWEKIPALVKEMDDTETASVALIENLQREELSSIEEATAYAKLLELHGLTQEALARQLGKGQSTIANKLRLLKLPDEVQNAIMEKKITERHARALIPLKEAELQVKLLKEVIQSRLNVKQTEDRVVKMLEGKVKKRKPRQKAVSKDMRIAMNTIRQSLGMVADSGMKVDSEEEEFDDYYQITIRLPKKK